MSVGASIVMTGDTIVTLAARLCGDGTRMHDLVTLNRLEPPYITDTGLPGTLKPGDTILYPRTAFSPPRPPSSELDVLTYKRDLKNERNGLLVRRGSAAMVSGLENLKEALLRRLGTPLGAHPAHPRTYGSRLHTHLGKVADRQRLELMKVDVRQAILRDPRVQSVTTAAYWVGQVAHFTITVTPISPGTDFTLIYNAQV